MIKCFFKFKVVFLSFVCSIAAHASCVEITPCCFSERIVEVKVGYFFFSNAKMRKIYDKGGLDLQMSSSYPIRCINEKWTLNAYAALEYFQKSGKSNNAHQKTSIWSLPVNIGLQVVNLTSLNLRCYFTAGPRYFYLHQHNRSSYVEKSRSGNTLGFFLNTGLQYNLCKGFALDFFSEYSYAKIYINCGKARVYTRSLQVGGFTLGAGLAYVF